MKLTTQLKEQLAEILETQIIPALTEVPFRSVAHLEAGIEFLVEGIEGLDTEELFGELKGSPEDFIDEDEEEEGV